MTAVYLDLWVIVFFVVFPVVTLFVGMLIEGVRRDRAAQRERAVRAAIRRHPAGRRRVDPDRPVHFYR